MQTPRRRFLQVAAAVATTRFPILGANDRINVGIVGLGGRGRDHVESYATLDPAARIAALCDVNQAALERAAALVKKRKGHDAAQFADMRRMFESKDVDAVSIATPNHWHALSTIWACQAGKDVYVEKPASHNVWEGGQMVKAARKYNRIVQVGTQSRSMPHMIKAIAALHNGVIGNVYGSRGLCFRRRFSIGHTPDEPVPPGLNWDLFLGPAQMKPYSKNKFAYNWHWFWDTGNGDIGNQGVHQVDICLWGFPRAGWPSTVASSGGKFMWKDDQETPNTLQTAFGFGDGEITFDVRNLPTPPEGLGGLRGHSYTGNIFFGDLGFMVLEGNGFQVYRSTAGNISGEAARGAGAGQQERYEKTVDEKAPHTGDDTAAHMKNFLDAVKARDPKILHADIEAGARSAAFCHLANISYRVHRSLAMDTAAGRFVNANDANDLLTRVYRKPYVVPSL